MRRAFDITNMPHPAPTLILAFLFLLLVSAGCGPNPAPKPTPPPAASPSVAPAHTTRASATPRPATPLPPTATPTPRQGGAVVQGGPSDVTTLNPLLADDDTSLMICGQLFDSLLAADAETGALVPRLARSWQVSDDGLTITFELRDDAVWHDGQSLTAADVAFTFETVFDPALNSPRRGALEAVADFEATDDTTFVVRLKEADCSVLYGLGLVGIVPRHVLEGRDVARAPFNTTTPIGSGPFVLTERVPGQYLTLSRNDRYWGQKAHIDTWTYRVVADVRPALEAGELDVAPIGPQDVAATEAMGRFEVRRAPAAEYYFVAFNNDHPILGDQRVRQALSYAVDRQRLVDEIAHGEGQLLSTSLLPGHWALSGVEGLAPFEYDPDRAADLLAQAGWSDSDGDGLRDRDGQPLMLRLSTNSDNRLREDIAVLVQQYYRAVGVGAQVEFMEWGNLVQDMFTHNFDAIVFSWPLGPDADGTPWWDSRQNTPGRGFNFVSYANPQVDGLLATGLTASRCDPAARARAYGQVAVILAEERPYDFLFAPYRLWAVNRRIGGVAPSPYAGPVWNLAQWHVR